MSGALLLHSLTKLPWLIYWLVMLLPIAAMLGCCLSIAGPGRRWHWLGCAAGISAIAALACGLLGSQWPEDRLAQWGTLLIQLLCLHLIPLMAACVRRDSNAT